MKRMRYIWSVMLAMVLLASCEEKLPEFDVTSIRFEAGWKEADLHLSAKVDYSSGVEIMEQGFVLELPVWHTGFWVDYEGDREVRTIKVPAGAEVTYVLPNEGWDEGLSCNAYAYLKTSAGNFRSDVVELNTMGPKEAQFTSLTHIPSAEGPWRGGGTLIIEGKNFSALKDNMKVCVVKKVETMGVTTLHIQELSGERIVATYPADQIGTVGEYEVQVSIGSRTYVLPQKMVIEGIRIRSVVPERPRHGEPVMMYLDNFTPGDVADILVDRPIDIEILEENYEGILFRVPEYPSCQYAITLIEKNGVMGDDFMLEVEPSWKELDMAKVGLDAIDIGDKGAGFVHRGSHVYYDGKNYVVNARKKLLTVFDTATMKWKQLDLPAVTQEWFLNNAQMFVCQGYLYMFVCMTTADMAGGFERWQYLCRMDLQTEQWEVVEEIDDADLMGERLTFAVTEDGIVYAAENNEYTNQYRLMEYRCSDGTWKESDHQLPAFAKLMGAYGNTLYYQNDSGIYAYTVGSGNQPVRITPSLTVWSFPVMADNFLYYIDEYTFCRVRMDVSEPKVERLGVPFVGLNFSSVLGFGMPVHVPEAPCLIWQPTYGDMKFYQYLPK